MTSDPSPSDLELTAAVRDGDPDAYGVLWQRHFHAARRAAVRISPRLDADDLVQEAFARTLAAIHAGKGPTDAFRPYLYATIRSVAIAWATRGPAIDLVEDVPDAPVPDDFADSSLDRSITATAFRALPADWRAVLWYTEVEGIPSSEAARFLGLTPNAAAALAYRAREGLRRAWLQAHLGTDHPPECDWVVERLGAYQRGGLTARQRDRVDAHVAGCLRCAVLVEELDEVARPLRAVLLPLVLGAGVLALDTAGLSSLAAPPPPASLGGAPSAASTGAATAPTPDAPAAAVGPAGSAAAAGGRRVLVGAATAAAVAVVGALAAVGLTGSGDPTAGPPTAAGAPATAPAPTSDTSPGSAAAGGASPAPTPRPTVPTPAVPTPTIPTPAVHAPVAGPAPGAPAPARPVTPPADPAPAPGPSAPAPAPGPTAPTTPAPEPTAPPSPSPEPTTPQAPLATVELTGSPAPGATLVWEPTLAGTGTPGAAVVVRCADGTPAGDTRVDADGTWALTPTSTCPPPDDPTAEHELRVVQRLDGRESPAVTVGPFRYALPTVVAPAGPVLDDGELELTVSADQPHAVRVRVDGRDVAVLAPGTGDTRTTVAAGVGAGAHDVEVRYVDPTAGREGPASSTEVVVRAPQAPAVTAADPAGSAMFLPRFEGTGVAGARVTVRDDEGAVVGEAVVADDGTWSLTVQDTGRTRASYAVRQRLGTGTPSAWSSPTEAYDFVVPEILAPVDGAALPGTGPAQVELAGVAGTVRAYLDGSRRGVHQLTGGTLVRSLGVLDPGEHTIALRYVEQRGGDDVRQGVLVSRTFVVLP